MNDAARHQYLCQAVLESVALHSAEVISTMDARGANTPALPLPIRHAYWTLTRPPPSGGHIKRLLATQTHGTTDCCAGTPPAWLCSLMDCY
ncbi:hypothetical protein NJH78_10005 [Pseudomonas chlororaphis]|nr:hypothetical protein [Pseudomonas chlororaphis]MCO7587454.1 hypothetical protein [Pseudomonas chlororaphis]